MTDTPADETFEFDPETDQDWPTDEFGPMSDYATEDDVVEMEDEDS